MNVSRIVSAGSTKIHLQQIALDIYDQCLKHKVQLEPTWIPREENTLADKISKIYDSVNWSIDNETFEYIQDKFGKFTYDRFADDLNHRVQNFNSKYYCPGSAAVNAFTCNWAYEFNWLCPPISLVVKVLRHMHTCKAKGVLFVPEWRSSYFWPLITENGVYFNSCVKQFLLLDPYYINNSDCSSVLEGFAKFRAYALYIDYSC